MIGKKNMKIIACANNKTRTRKNYTQLGKEYNEI